MNWMSVKQWAWTCCYTLYTCMHACLLNKCWQIWNVTVSRPFRYTKFNSTLHELICFSFIYLNTTFFVLCVFFSLYFCCSGMQSFNKSKTVRWSTHNIEFVIFSVCVCIVVNFGLKCSLSQKAISDTHNIHMKRARIFASSKKIINAFNSTTFDVRCDFFFLLLFKPFLFIFLTLILSLLHSRSHIRKLYV